MRKRELEDLLMKAVAEALGVEAVDTPEREIKSVSAAVERRSRADERVAA